MVHKKGLTSKEKQDIGKLLSDGNTTVRNCKMVEQ